MAYFRLILGTLRDPRAGLRNPRKGTYSSYHSARPACLRAPRRQAATLISLFIVLGALLPATARASVLDTFLSALKKTASIGQTTSAQSTSPGNLQTMTLLQPAMNLDPAGGTGGGDITIVDDSALVPEEGPAGTIADIEKPKVSTISTYIVREGDTPSSIAKLFGVSVGTVLSANDLTSKSVLQVGQKLVILPITGINYTVKKGDTLASIAKRYGGDVTEIRNYNAIEGESLTVGQQILIPNGEASAVASSGSKGSTAPPKGSAGVFANNPKEPAHDVGAPGSSAEVSYYIAPLSHYTKTQRIHGYNAVDLAAPPGSPVVASASGDVVIAKQGGWNGGYGSYVVISHSNGSQTLYAHLSKVETYDGAHVVQGEVIGSVGSTGESTGPHVHFEIRNGIRNPF